MLTKFQPILRLLVLGLPLLTASRCQSPSTGKTGNDDGSTVLADSIYAKGIDSLILSTSEAMRALPVPGKIPVQLYSVKDSLFVFLSPDKSGQVHASFYPADTWIWPTYYFKEGKVIMVRFREWRDQNTTPVMRESQVYYKDGQPYYCEERAMQAKPGDQPYMLRELPWSPSQRPLAEIAESYAEYWPVLAKAVPALNALQQP